MAAAIAKSFRISGMGASHLGADVFTLVQELLFGVRIRQPWDASIFYKLELLFDAISFEFIAS